MATKKRTTASILAEHRDNTDRLYGLCRTGRGKDIPKARERFLKSHDEMEKRIHEIEGDGNGREGN